MTYRKAGAISSPPRKECGYVRGRRLTSARDEEIRATREMALAIARGLAGKAKRCTSSVAGTTRLAPWLLQLGRISFRWTEPARDAAGAVNGSDRRAGSRCCKDVATMAMNLIGEPLSH